jgi:hypothetical protein
MNVSIEINAQLVHYKVSIPTNKEQMQFQQM